MTVCTPPTQLDSATLFVSVAPGAPPADTAALQAELARLGLAARHLACVNLLEQPLRGKAARVHVTPSVLLKAGAARALLSGGLRGLDRAALDAAWISFDTDEGLR